MTNIEVIMCKLALRFYEAKMTLAWAWVLIALAGVAREHHLIHMLLELSDPKVSAKSLA
jgi:hypothetical protein